jgi:hypothetical protein
MGLSLPPSTAAQLHDLFLEKPADYACDAALTG